MNIKILKNLLGYKIPVSFKIFFKLRFKILLHGVLKDEVTMSNSEFISRTLIIEHFSTCSFLYSGKHNRTKSRTFGVKQLINDCSHLIFKIKTL